MTSREAVLKEATRCLRVAHYYEQITEAFVQRAEVMTHCAELADDELSRMMFLRANVCIVHA